MGLRRKVEMRDELAAVVFDFRDQRGERVGYDAQCRVKVRLEAVGIFNDAPPVVLTLEVSKQFAPIEDACVEEVPISIKPEPALWVIGIE